MFYLYYNSNVSDNVYAMAFKLGMTVDLCMSYLDAHTHFDDLDLVERSQWVGRGK